MQRHLLAFADEYDTAADRLIDNNDGQLSINNPLLFVFIGDHSLDALNAVYDLNKKKWTNNTGVLYFHIYKDKTVARENVFSLRLPVHEVARKTVRAEIRRQFYHNSQALIELNRTTRQISNRIAEHGKLYSSFQRLNMAVVTRIDDPCNVIMQEVVVLLKTLLGESFKMIQMDMYGLMKEKQEEEEYAYSASLGISFLRELDQYQDRAYSFSGMLQVTEDQIRLPTEHVESPLFDLVYLLSDKNEHAMFPDGGMEANYEIICNMNLLKNRKIVEENDHRHESYNNQHFRQQIQPAETKGVVYSTAGFSKVKRPNQAIALTVVSHFYQNLTGRLIEQSKADKRTIVELLRLSPDSLDRKALQLLPSRGKLAEMNGLLSETVAYSDLRKLTLRQAEEQLYGKYAAAFFTEHFAEAAEERLDGMDLESELQETIERMVIHNPEYGLYCAYTWTSEEDRSVIHELRQMGRDTAKQLEEVRLQLLQLEEEPVEAQSLPGFALFDKAKSKKLGSHLFAKVYGKKLDVLFLEIKFSLLKRYESAVQNIHDPLQHQIRQLQELDKVMRATYRQSVSEANDYLGRNIPEYYSNVVTEIMEDLCAKRGEQFYWEDRYIGDIANHLSNGAEALLKRVIEVCKKEVFTYPAFRQSFEDELLKRANILVRYEDKDKVLSREELYRDLYDSLEKSAAVHMDVYNYTHKHRYDEKYYFADFDSEFIRYAFDVDKSSRLYKLGCVHEKKTSGTEKLNIMGGFQLEDLMYVRNGKRYYASYMANGFQFHSEDSRMKEPD